VFTARAGRGTCHNAKPLQDQFRHLNNHLQTPKPRTAPQALTENVSPVSQNENTKVT
jgi:hypothetical protein